MVSKLNLSQIRLPTGAKLVTTWQKHLWVAEKWARWRKKGCFVTPENVGDMKAKTRFYSYY
jgi:hypothetical protein